jgi:outer membrane protein OmpA-like peptidoglycan-associated protein
MCLTIRVALGFALTVAAGSAFAQDYTADELRELFTKQRAAVSEGLGATRGLRIVTQDTASSTGATLAGEADVSSPAGTVSATDTPLQAVSMPQDTQINLQIKFDFDSAALKPAEQARLAPMCEAMKTSDVQVLRIVGHTDSSGSDAYNEALSRLRAEEVARYLVESCGIDPSRLQTMGLGERMPMNPDDPAGDENRRVEFQALS